MAAGCVALILVGAAAVVAYALMQKGISAAATQAGYDYAAKKAVLRNEPGLSELGYPKKQKI